MKRHQILILLIVVTAMAVAGLFLRQSPQSETASSEEVAVIEKPLADANEGESEPAPRDRSQTVNVPMEAEASSKPEHRPAESEAVAEEIRDTFVKARTIMQKKAAIAQSSPSEVHHMPRQTLEAAKSLGEIAELEARNPEQAESFREFYLECARDAQTITVTRAQCLDKYVKASKLDATAQKELLQEFPEEIVRLFEALQ
jgi:hypothetical protein